MVVQHNMQAANASRTLNITTDSQSKSTEKLSSGYKINRAADDAAGLSISEKMRRQIRGLTQASTNASDGVSSVQTAEGALTEVHDMLQRMNELAVQAANGTNSESDRSDIQNEIDQLTQEIDRIAQKRGLIQDVLLEINIGEEASKSGFYPDELENVLAETANLPAVRVRGLMAIPPICEKPEENRPFFLKMQKLFVDNCRKKYDNISMDFLSMGMSGDYPEAVRCGANMVRIGSGIFGPRNYT